MNQKMRSLNDIEDERRSRWVERWRMLSICMSLQCKIVDRDSWDRSDLISQMIVLGQSEEDQWVFRAKFHEMMCSLDCHPTGKLQVSDLMIKKILDENSKVLFRFWMRRLMKGLSMNIEIQEEDDYSHHKMNDILYE